MDFLIQKRGSILIPVYNSDAESLKDAKLKEGEVYQVKITKPRNYEFHKKYFALINLCFENQEVFKEINDLRSYLIMKAGYVKRIDTGTGEMILPKSISFANMDDIEFNKLYNKTIDVIINFLHISEGELLNELLNYL